MPRRCSRNTRSYEAGLTRQTTCRSTSQETAGLVAFAAEGGVPDGRKPLVDVSGWDTVHFQANIPRQDPCGWDVLGPLLSAERSKAGDHGRSEGCRGGQSERGGRRLWEADDGSGSRVKGRLF